LVAGEPIWTEEKAIDSHLDRASPTSINDDGFSVKNHVVVTLTWPVNDRAWFNELSKVMPGDAIRPLAPFQQYWI
jgi:hypothetical protein